jgi:hypothetical protein
MVESCMQLQWHVLSVGAEIQYQPSHAAHYPNPPLRTRFAIRPSRAAPPRLACRTDGRLRRCGSPRKSALERSGTGLLRVKPSKIPAIPSIPNSQRKDTRRPSCFLIRSRRTTDEALPRPQHDHDHRPRRAGPPTCSPTSTSRSTCSAAEPLLPAPALASCNTNTNTRTRITPPYIPRI